MKHEQAGSKKILKNKYIPTAEFYSQIIDSLQDYAIFTLDKRLKINSWSSGSSIIFGYETDEVIGKKFDIIFTKEDKINGIPKKEIETALKEGRAVDNRWHICRDGSRFFAYGLVFPLTGIDGVLLGYVKILRDLSERKKSEEAIKKYVKDLEELNAHKESLLAILSHDLRSPLSGIIGTAEFLKSNFHKMAQSKVKQMLDSLYEASTDELTMLDNLLDWARVKYASQIFSPKKINLVQYIKTIFGSLHEVAALRKITLLNEVKEDISVFADEKMLLTILQNIVSNAIKYSHRKGMIKVTAKSDADRIIVQIKDNGIGMSKQILDKLFTPQISLLSKARKKNKGAGIGLLLVKGFLEKNDGKIWAESTVGEGTSFYFSLPVNKPEDKLDSASSIVFDENE